MNTIVKIAGGVAATAVLTIMPLVPKDLTLLYSYQYPVTPGTAHALQLDNPVFHNGVEVDYTELQQGFVDDNGDGVISVAVFQDSNKNRVYVQIPETRYGAMGLKNGYAQNPTKTEFTSLFDALIAPVPSAQAAIAFDAASTIQNTAGTSITYAFTTTGTNRILTCAASTGGGDHLTSGSYNSVSQIQASKSTNISDGSATVYIYYLKNPDVGTNNVVFNTTSGGIQSNCTSYTGALQTGGVDTSTPYYNATKENGDISVTVNVSAANSWLVTTFDSTDDNPTLAVNGVARQTLNADSIVDSNAAVATGNQTIGYHWVTLDRHAIVALAFAPVAAAAAATFNPWQFSDF